MNNVHSFKLEFVGFNIHVSANTYDYLGRMKNNVFTISLERLTKHVD